MSKNKKVQFDLLIIGGGAAGMTAAITAARNQKRVCIIEKMDKLGKKIFATGNGKCNFTNENMQMDCFHGDTSFLNYILNAFSVEDCLAFFHSIGICPKNKNGYYYPNSEQAASVVTALVLELQKLRVSIYCETMVKEILSLPDHIRIETDKGSFYSKKLLIATGLLASPKLGSDGSLFEQIKSLGHSFSPVLPALCGFYCKGISFRKASGVRVQGTVRALVNDEILATDTGEIQFTEYGLSGIPIFQISSYLSKGIYQKAKTEIYLNLLPDFNKNQLFNELNYRKSVLGEETAEYLLNGLLNQKLSNIILEKSRIDPSVYIFSLTEKELNQLAHTIQNLKIKVTNYREYEFAQICTGGIPISDINNRTLESKFADNVYFAGEILDVDGICGGYNLHFAWASGSIAAKAATEREL